MSADEVPPDNLSPSRRESRFPARSRSSSRTAPACAPVSSAASLSALRKSAPGCEACPARRRENLLRNDDDRMLGLSDLDSLQNQRGSPKLHRHTREHRTQRHASCWHPGNYLRRKNQARLPSGPSVPSFSGATIRVQSQSPVTHEGHWKGAVATTTMIGRVPLSSRTGT